MEGTRVRFLFDVTQRSVVVVCSCGWRAITTDGKQRADQLAHAHRLASHPEDRTAARQIEQRMARRERGQGL